MTESPEDYELFHYGVKGMKWGVRRDGSGRGASRVSGMASKVRTKIKDRDDRIRTARDNLDEASNKNIDAKYELAKATVGLVRKKNQGHRLERLNTALKKSNDAGEEYASIRDVAMKKTSSEIVKSTAWALGTTTISAMAGPMRAQKANRINNKTATKFGKAHAERFFNDNADSRGLSAPNVISLGPNDVRVGR